ncbi:WbqC family protein [Bacteroidota bacterium]
MTVAIHQPNFIPWIGYFYKIFNSDIFVLLDDVQYTKNSYINRNKIKTPQGAQWLTIPVLKSGKFGQTIHETMIANPEKSISTVLKSIEQNYKKAPYFSGFFEEFSNLLALHNYNLADLNTALIKWMVNIFGIQTKIVHSSELENIKGNSTGRLISICRHFNAGVYFSGFGGSNYQEENEFKEAGIKLRVTDFNYPEYRQLWGDFIPNLSALDLLFNTGSNSKSYIFQT